MSTEPTDGGHTAEVVPLHAVEAPDDAALAGAPAPV